MSGPRWTVCVVCGRAFEGEKLVPGPDRGGLCSLKCILKRLLVGPSAEQTKKPERPS